MNIFYLDSNPVKAALYHNKKHSVKMIVESAQMLATAYYVSVGITSSKQAKSEQYKNIVNSLFNNFPRKFDDGTIHPYGISHANHPCTVWAYSSLENWNWLCKLGLALCFLYTKNYGKEHSCQKILVWMSKNKPNISSNVSFTEPPLAMPDDCKIPNDVVESYRNYYKTHKRHIADWHNNNVPYWF